MAELQIGDLLEQSKALPVTPQDNRRDSMLEVGVKNLELTIGPSVIGVIIVMTNASLHFGRTALALLVGVGVLAGTSIFVRSYFRG